MGGHLEDAGLGSRSDVSSCSGSSSCSTEKSYHLENWKGYLSMSWESIASASSNFLVPPTGGASCQGASQAGSDDASSMSEISGISGGTGSLLEDLPATGLAAAPLNTFSEERAKGVVKSAPPTAALLVLETVELGGIVRHYLMPKAVTNSRRGQGELRKRGTKLRIFQDHILFAKRVRG